MSLRYFIHILFKRKWYILTAVIAAPLLTLAFLLFVEPVYVSRCKLEVHDRSSDSDPLAARRSNVKDDVFIQSQIDLIFTDQVLGKAVDKAELVPEPPSQSLIARLAGYQPAPSNYPPERQRIEAIRALRKRVSADPTSPVIFTISAQMNTPELAQKVSKAVYDSYVEEFDRHRSEDAQVQQIYERRLKGLENMIQECRRDMEEFSRLHPRLAVTGPDALIIPDRTNPPIDVKPPEDQVIKRPNTENPVQTVQNEISRLEIEAITVAAGNSPESYAYRTVQEKILKNKALLEKYKKEYAEQEILVLRYSGLTFRMEMLQQSYQKVNDEYQRALTQILTKSKSQGTISVLDKPTYDPQAIYPRKTLIMIAAMFVGLVLGFGMAYIAHVLDSTYHLPEDFAADTGLPVLAAIPYERELIFSSESMRVE